MREYHKHVFAKPRAKTETNDGHTHPDSMQRIRKSPKAMTVVRIDSGRIASSTLSAWLLSWPRGLVRKARVIYTANKATSAGRDVKREIKSPLEMVMIARRASADVDKDDSVRLVQGEEQSLKRNVRTFD